MRLPLESLVSIDGTPGYLRLSVLVLGLALLAALVNRLGRLDHAGASLRAAGRATLQLAAVGVVIAAVLASWWLTAGFVLLMLTVASFTAGRRMTGDRSLWWAAGAVWAGAVPVSGLLLASGLIPLRPVAVVPVLGILIGGAMTATVLAGRRSLDALHGRHGEYEAALSLGLLERDAAMLVARPDASLALLPGLDQTRTVGLVTLPGAFVGMLLGGATPVQAAAVQLLVLVALLLVQSISVTVTVELIARRMLARSGR